LGALCRISVALFSAFRVVSVKIFFDVFLPVSFKYFLVLCLVVVSVVPLVLVGEFPWDHVFALSCVSCVFSSCASFTAVLAAVLAAR
jgi:hypothetical protein